LLFTDAPEVKETCSPHEEPSILDKTRFKILRLACFRCETSQAFFVALPLTLRSAAGHGGLKLEQEICFIAQKVVNLHQNP